MRKAHQTKIIKRGVFGIEENFSPLALNASVLDTCVYVRACELSRMCLVCYIVYAHTLATTEGSINEIIFYVA